MSTTRHRLGAAAAAGALALAALLAGAPAHARPEPHLKLHPIDAGTWEAGTGLPDTFGDADTGLVGAIGNPNDAPDPHPEVAEVTGLEGRPTTALEHVAFATLGDRVGIQPCIKVAYTDPLGRAGEIMVTGTMMTRYEIGGHPDWYGYAYDGPWPAGTIDAVELGIHIDFFDPPEPDRIVFDNIEINTKTWTHPGDNGTNHGFVAPPDPD